MTPSNIPFIYRLFHLYIEPFILIPGGIYLSLFAPSDFITGTIPVSIASPYHRLSPSIEPVTPLVRHLLANTAALYALLGLTEALALRSTKEMSVWRAIIFAIFVCDCVHLYALALVAPKVLGGAGEWGVEDWSNAGILAAGWVLRGAFVAGVGLGKGRRRGGKGS